MFKKHPLQRGCFFLIPCLLRVLDGYVQLLQDPITPTINHLLIPLFVLPIYHFFKNGVFFIKKHDFIFFFLSYSKKNTNFVSFFASGKYNVSLFNA